MRSAKLLRRGCRKSASSLECEILIIEPSAIELPPEVANVVEILSKTMGTVAIALGGSRSTGVSDSFSDWDIGVYYRGGIDLRPLERFGKVYQPGAWGRIMNGGAWLTIADVSVDVLLRDLNVVQYWKDHASAGSFEVDSLPGFIAGVPTYLLVAELSSCRVLYGHLPKVCYPQPLRESASGIWRYRRSFSIGYARKHALRNERVGAIGQMAKAVMEECHARLAERGQWICNEKRLVEEAGLSSMQSLLSGVMADSSDLRCWVDKLEAQLSGPDPAIHGLR